MKTKITLFFIAASVTLSGYCQSTHKEKAEVTLVEENEIGFTYYDVQTTRSMQNRIYRFDDNTIGTVFNMGLEFPIPYDRLIGYNYFDGNSWGSIPTASITSGQATNPSYAQYGENGEIVVSEGANGLYFNYRINKGTGPWEEFL